VTPALRRLKLATFGHDLVVLHEHDIRKKERAFAMMSRVIEAAPSRWWRVIDKRGLRRTTPRRQTRITWRCSLGLERVFGCWADAGSRGGSRISSWRHAASGRHGTGTGVPPDLRRRQWSGQALPFPAVMADKRTHSEGCKSRHGGSSRGALGVCAPASRTRRCVLENNSGAGPDGRMEGYGLNCFPEKSEGPPGSPSGPLPNGSPISKPGYE